jgi:hypothetical protein
MRSAIGCQKKIAKAIRGAGADYRNRRCVRDFADCASGRWQALETTNADHGRTEVRRHWIVHDIEWLDFTSITMFNSNMETHRRLRAADAVAFGHSGPLLGARP